MVWTILLPHWLECQRAVFIISISTGEAHEDTVAWALGHVPLHPTTLIEKQGEGSAPVRGEDGLVGVGPTGPLGRIGGGTDPCDLQGPPGFVVPGVCELLNPRLHLLDYRWFVVIIECLIYLVKYGSPVTGEISIIPEWSHQGHTVPACEASKRRVRIGENLVL